MEIAVISLVNTNYLIYNSSTVHRGVFLGRKMRKETMQMNKKTDRIRCNRLFAAAALAVMLTFCAACGSADTAALQTEEIVWSDTEQGMEKVRTGTDSGASGQRDTGAETDSASLPAEASEPAEDTAQYEKSGKAPDYGVSLLYVHICGAVCAPGVYELPEGSRVYEAVEKAGGFAENANQNYVNLSLPLEDGWKIVVPTTEETDVLAAENGPAGQQAEAGIVTGQSGITQKESPRGEALAAGLLDINNASREELCTLPGIGESRAESIIAYREKHGGFASIEDIMKIEGIKEGMFSKIKDRICVR